MSSTLHFPSEIAIIAYLEQHPLTGIEQNPYFTEKKMIEAVAKFFANQEKDPLGVDIGVICIMHDLNEKLRLPDVGVLLAQKSLTIALKDCANGKKIEIKKLEITSKL